MNTTAKPNVRKVVCGNCEWTGSIFDSKPLCECLDLGDRLESGDEVPAGECRHCGEFVYFMKPAYVGGVK